MRFLCLHGYATSVEVLQEQMEPITSQLPGNWEYEFLEAGMEPSELMLRKYHPGDHNIIFGKADSY